MKSRHSRTESDRGHRRGGDGVGRVRLGIIIPGHQPPALGGEDAALAPATLLQEKSHRRRHHP